MHGSILPYDRAALCHLTKCNRVCEPRHGSVLPLHCPRFVTLSERADVVFIQEMVPVVYTYMEERLPQYMFIAAGSEEYFTTMLLRRTSVYFDGHELLPFPGSCMGRNLLVVEVSIGLHADVK